MLLLHIFDYFYIFWPKPTKPTNALWNINPQFPTHFNNTQVGCKFPPRSGTMLRFAQWSARVRLGNLGAFPAAAGVSLLLHTRTHFVMLLASFWVLHVMHLPLAVNVCVNVHTCTRKAPQLRVSSNRTYRVVRSRRVCLTCFSRTNIQLA